MLKSYQMKAQKIVRAEKLAGNNNNLLVLELAGGSKLVGHSIGIESEEDDSGEDYDVLAFMCPDLDNIIFRFTDDQIKSVDLA